MNAKFVRRHCKFGKARLRPNKRFEDAGWIGVADSQWFVRAYYKKEIKAFRVEVQFNRASLVRYSITNSVDVARLSELVIRKLGFYSVDWASVERFIRRHLRHPETLLSMARRREGDLTNVLSFLRVIGISNPSRFLIRLPVNAQIADAVTRWRRRWVRGGNGVLKTR